LGIHRDIESRIKSTLIPLRDLLPQAGEGKARRSRDCPGEGTARRREHGSCRSPFRGELCGACVEMEHCSRRRSCRSLRRWVGGCGCLRS
jgi:hypothetical protein